MKKIIEKSKEEIAEHYCDGCHNLVLIAGLPEDAVPETYKKFGVALQMDLGYNGNTAALFGNLDLCEECGWKLVKSAESLFGIEIKTPEWDNV